MIHNRTRMDGTPIEVCTAVQLEYFIVVFPPCFLRKGEQHEVYEHSLGST